MYIIYSPSILTGVLARNLSSFHKQYTGEVFLSADIFLNALILTYQNYLDKNSSILLTFGFKIKE